MLKGVYLTLLIGPGVPVPALKSVVDALINVQVNTGGERTGFQLVFSMNNKSSIRNTLLPAGYFDPIVTRVILVATVSGMPHVLCDGVVTRHEVSPSNEPGHSTLTITGEDLSVLMDIVQAPFMRYPAMPITARLYVILAKYLVFGVVPLVIPPIFEDVPIPIDKIPSQTGSDLAYIKKLAKDVGYVFYVEAGPAPATSIAYFGPNIRIPIPQSALNVNMDAQTNVESLSFSLDGLAKKIIIMNILDPITKKVVVPIPLPNVSLLNPPLGARLTPPSKVEWADDAAHKNPIEAAALALAKIGDSSDAVSGSGTLNVLRYGKILKARQLVGVRGAGLAYDGMYYVKTVTHSLKRGEYKQNFTLSRDGLISQTPRVFV
ncbi:MAG TPA: hypothetical protein VEX68_21595 [Bryobacteraceae bacterium]|nr:hypothetical protein [Bryobacteraceae bacterium]